MQNRPIHNHVNSKYTCSDILLFFSLLLNSVSAFYVRSSFDFGQPGQSAWVSSWSANANRKQTLSADTESRPGVWLRSVCGAFKHNKQVLIF